jgi:hypothetical protein
MRKPNTAVIIGGGGNFGGIGTIWHLFDQRLQIPLTLLEHDRISPTALLRYNTIILYGNYEFNDETANALRAWHRAGGTFIAIGESWRTINRIGVANIERVETARVSEQPDHVFLPFTDRASPRRGSRIPGVILECRLDRTSPIGYGIMSSTIPVIRESTNIFRSPTPFSAPVSFLNNPLLSGYITPNALREVANTPAVLKFPRVVYFADGPVFRAHWFGTTRMFMNAVFFPFD